MTFEFELTDEQEDKVEDLRSEVFNSGKECFVFCCQLYFPHPDFPTVEKPKVKGRVYFDEEAKILDSIFRLLKKARNSES